MLRTSPLVVLAAATGLAGAKTYNLHQYSGGNGFYDAWTWPGDKMTNGAPVPDLNNGDNFMASKAYAMSSGLTTVNGAGNAVLKVDDTSTVVYNDKRYSIRIESAELYGPGTVFVLDAVHIPFGCSVWPAYWTSALTWPDGGEIDIMENVNRVTNNQMALHTKATCALQGDASSNGFSGNLINADCQTHFDDTGKLITSNTGCIVRDPSTQSYGEGFNGAGGGVWVTEFATDSISIWFYPRASVPEAVKGNTSTIDTSALGTPVAHYANAGCDFKTAFQPQKVVIDISLCGDFARPTFNSTCPGTRDNSCYLDWVIGPPGNYSQAYFEITSHRVFTDGTSTPTPAPGGASPSNGAGGATSPTGTTGSNTGGDNGLGGNGTGSGSRVVTSFGSIAAVVAFVAAVGAAL